MEHSYRVEYVYLYSIGNTQPIGGVTFEGTREQEEFRLFGVDFDPADPPKTIHNPHGDIPGLAVLKCANRQ